MKELAAMAIWRMPKVVEETGLSSPTIYRRMANGTFPARKRLGGKPVGWEQSDVEKWKAELETVPCRDVPDGATGRNKSRDMSQASEAKRSNSPGRAPEEIMVVTQKDGSQKALGDALTGLGFERVKMEVYAYRADSATESGKPRTKVAERQAKSRKVAREGGQIEFSRRIPIEDKEFFSALIKLRKEGLGLNDALAAMRSARGLVRTRPVFLGVLAGQIALSAAYIVPTVFGEPIVRAALELGWRFSG